MKKEIKDYLHFYLGCECIDDAGKRARIARIGIPQENNSIITLTIRYSDEVGDFRIFSSNQGVYPVKLILRSLSDMTEKEAVNIGWEETKAKKAELTFEEFKKDLNEHMFFAPEEFTYLLKNGFDLFSLIESGLAIDAKILTPTT